MSSTIPATPGSLSNADDVLKGCVELFRELTLLDEKKDGAAMTDAEVAATPIQQFDLDSLSTMEFIMAVEDRFDVVLDEQAVNECATLAELAGLIKKS